MKLTHRIWLLCATLMVSVLANAVLARSNLEYFDEAYVEMAKQHLLISKVRDQLEREDVTAAKALLDREIEAKGSILAICMIENCSSSAEAIMHGDEKL